MLTPHERVDLVLAVQHGFVYTHLAWAGSTVGLQLCFDPSQNRHAKLFLKDGGTLGSLAYALGMPSTGWSAAQSVFAKASSVQCLE